MRCSRLLEMRRNCFTEAIGTGIKLGGKPAWGRNIYCHTRVLLKYATIQVKCLFPNQSAVTPKNQELTSWLLFFFTCSCAGTVRYPRFSLKHQSQGSRNNVVPSTLVCRYGAHLSVSPSRRFKKKKLTWSSRSKQLKMGTVGGRCDKDYITITKRPGIKEGWGSCR